MLHFVVFALSGSPHSTVLVKVDPYSWWIHNLIMYSHCYYQFLKVLQILEMQRRVLVSLALFSLSRVPGIFSSNAFLSLTL
jgi:hypothetical protein